jgi:F0F1-type ATP synthase membrane subunit c/vacuolar-type H+-ATPase subunit K
MNRSDLAVPQRFRTLAVVCVAIALGLVLVNAVVAVLWVSGSPPAGAISLDVSLASVVVALLLLAAAPTAKRVVFKRAQAQEGFERDPAARLNAYARGMILGFAMREAAGLIGFVLALLSGNPWWSWGLGGTALVAMYSDRPRREDLGA